ncbi:LmeA family phospholipid-binding protein [Streptomyces sp. NPDC052040]|uniref:LmeA family phospholipid-binding protein n=1 Tax=unclassified Streptomyces TaxID=2593676 RepID=UPI0037CD849A
MRRTPSPATLRRTPAAPAPARTGRPLLRRPRAVAALALTALVLTAAGAELTARIVLHDRLAAAAGRALGSGTDIHTGGGPALLALGEGHLDTVTLHNGHARLGNLPDVSVRARLDDVHLTGRHSATVARTEAEVVVPGASLEELAAASGRRIPVTGVRLDPRAGTVVLALGQGGLARATLRPRLEDGRVTFAVESAELLGSPAPAALLDRIRTTLSDRPRTAYPLGLKATALHITDSGLRVTLTGGHAGLPAKTP